MNLLKKGKFKAKIFFQIVLNEVLKTCKNDLCQTLIENNKK